MSKFCDIMIGVCIGVAIVAIGSWVHQSLSDPTYIVWATNRPAEIRIHSDTISSTPVRFIRETVEYSNIVVAYYDEKGNWIVVNSFYGTDSEPWRFWEGDYPVW